MANDSSIILNVEVSQKDIDEGCSGSASNCPLAKAIQRAIALHHKFQNAIWVPSVSARSIRLHKSTAHPLAILRREGEHYSRIDSDATTYVVEYNADVSPKLQDFIKNIDCNWKHLEAPFSVILTFNPERKL